MFFPRRHFQESSVAMLIEKHAVSQGHQSDIIFKILSQTKSDVIFIGRRAFSFIIKCNVFTINVSPGTHNSIFKSIFSSSSREENESIHGQVMHKNDNNINTKLSIDRIFELCQKNFQMYIFILCFKASQ